MNKKLFLSIVAICLLISSALYAQVTIPTNFAPLGTQYVGWSGAAGSTSKPLDVKNFFANQNIDFYTNGTGANGTSVKRMTIIGSAGATTGFVGINTPAPSELLQLTGGNVDISTSTNALMIAGIRTLWRGATGSVTNIFVGANAGATNTGLRNTFVGNNAGAANTNGPDNTFVGANAGKKEKEV